MNSAMVADQLTTIVLGTAFIVFVALPMATSVVARTWFRERRKHLIDMLRSEKEKL